MIYLVSKINPIIARYGRWSAAADFGKEREIELHSWLSRASRRRHAAGIIICKCGWRRLGCL